MCGIAGVIESDGLRVDDAALLRALSAIRHRGPDDQGVWSEGPVKLGHRRLSIIDLSPAGRQPMASSDGRFVVTYNGEIYNFTALRAELEARGSRTWRGSSDTEVLVELIVEIGLEPALKKLNGMFALAVWDRAERMLCLARDRFGEKPLYYVERAGGLAFASELTALEAMGVTERQLSQEALGRYFVRGYFAAPDCIYTDVRKLPPASFLSWRSGQAATLHTYWSLDEVIRAGAPARQAPLDRVAAAAELDRLVQAAVAQRSISDVTLGVFLSGGVDSSIIAAALQRTSSRPITTFTLGFDDPALNETDHARQIAAHIGTRHIEAIVTPRDALDTVSVLGRLYDEPLADDSSAPTYLLSAMARKHVTVALAGDGGDEMFGGYRRYHGTPALWRAMRRAPLRSLAGKIASATPTPVLDVAFGFLKEFSDRHGKGAGVGQTLHRIAPWTRARSLLELYQHSLQKWPSHALPLHSLARIEPAWPIASAPADGELDQLSWHDQHNYLPGDILTKTDRASMAVSLETRLPLLDPDIAAFAWRLPEEARRGKAILKDALALHVPRALFERPKAGFTPPLEKWLLGPLNAWANDLLSPERLRRQGLLDERRVAAFWRVFQRGGTLEEGRAWSLLMFQAWLDARGK